VRGAGLPAAVLHGRLGSGRAHPLPDPRRGRGMSPYRRALRDPAFLGAVAERWSGSRPPLDALRGLDDDEEGSPYAGLDTRRAALYRPGVDPAEGAEVGRLIRERDELRAVVAAVLQDQGARAARIPVDPAATVPRSRRA